MQFNYDDQPVLTGIKTTFSMEGRRHRLSYIGHSCLAALPMIPAMGLTIGGLSDDPSLSPGLQGAALTLAFMLFVFVFVVQCFYLAQRFRDFNFPAWLGVPLYVVALPAFEAVTTGTSVNVLALGLSLAASLALMLTPSAAK